MTGVYDLPSTVWAYIFAGSAVALVIALRVTDMVNQRKARRRSMGLRDDPPGR